MLRKGEQSRLVTLVPLWYRAPEVILRMPFNEEIDMWSLGVLAAELATGFPLYPGKKEYDVLRFIVKTQGQPADHVLHRGMASEVYLYRGPGNAQLCWIFKQTRDFTDEMGYYATETRHYQLSDLDHFKPLMTVEGHPNDQVLFMDLIKRLLHLDADPRIKPLEVLQHPFFLQSLPHSPTEQPSCSQTPGCIQHRKT
ncbi:Homeodomain-interacting protein kinase 2 [Larimichthys crocea]|uniref:Homeodomain-interacting protein kinase 2 n=1 Tax=Larimichthys crocea TaxID=215358 RepID=A0A6G0IB44_LARCR|nr:Homeodomain-interacting protein kinase 2 [Larimichthys crocea]